MIRKIEPGYGPVVSLFLGAAIVSLMSITAFLMEDFFLSNYLLSDIALSFNWYSMTFEPLSHSPIIFVVCFVIQAVILTAVAIFFASKDFLVVAVETPERVLIERQPNKKSTLPVGESIDEIFGELPLGPRGGDNA